MSTHTFKKITFKGIHRWQLYFENSSFAKIWSKCWVSLPADTPNLSCLRFLSLSLFVDCPMQSSPTFHFFSSYCLLLILLFYFYYTYFYYYYYYYYYIYYFCYCCFYYFYLFYYYSSSLLSLCRLSIWVLPNFSFLQQICKTDHSQKLDCALNNGDFYDRRFAAKGDEKDDDVTKKFHPHRQALAQVHWK